jgi:hypothetical protein
MDSHLGPGPHGPGPFSLQREIVALVLVGMALAARAVGKARWPNADPSAQWFLAAIAGLLVLFAVPLQALGIIYAAGILAMTSLRSPLANASLAVGAIGGLTASLAAGLAIYQLASSSDRYVGLLFLGTVTTVFLAAALAGVVAAWLVPGTGDPADLRVARGRQGIYAGVVAGAVCGLLLTDFIVLAVVMMVIGPLAGAAGGAAGGFGAANHPRRSRPARSWAAGLFVRS